MDRPQWRYAWSLLGIALAGLLSGCPAPKPEEAPVPYWYETTQHGSAFRNVRDFGAKGDGVADDTAAIQAAIDRQRGVRYEKKPAIVYVPTGTYRISDTLILWKWTHLVGNPHDPPTIVLAAKSPGFDNPKAKKPAIVTTNGWCVDPKSRNWPANSDKLGASANNTFYTQVHHLGVRIERGNPGAVGILWRVAQATSIRNVTLDAGDAAIALDIGGGTDYAAFATQPSQGGGGVIADTRISGGRVGLRAWGSQWLFRSVHLNGQKEIGVHVRNCWNFDFLDLQVTNAPLGMRIEKSMVVLLLASRFANITGGRAISTDGSPCYVEHLVCDRVARVLDDAIPGHPKGFTRVPAWFQGWGIANSEPIDAGPTWPPHDKPLPLRPRPVFGDEPLVNALDTGALGDGEADDTQAIQKAIDTSRTVFLPFGRYKLTDTLRLRRDTRLVGEGLCELFLAPNAPGFGNPHKPKPVLLTPDDPKGTAVLADLRLTAGEGNAGAVMVEWRVGERSGMWDVHIAPHPKTGVACQLHLSGNGGGYFENMWNPGTGPTGFLGESPGPAWFYGTPFEHQTQAGYHLRGARRYTFVTAQTEQSPLAMLVEDSTDIAVYGTVFTYWRKLQPHLFKLSNSTGVTAVGLNCHNSEWLVHAEPTEVNGFALPGGKDWHGITLMRIGSR